MLTLPFTQFGIGVAQFSLTISDIILCFSFIWTSKNLASRDISPAIGLLRLLGCILLGCAISILHIKSAFRFATGLLPFLFALLQILTITEIYLRIPNFFFPTVASAIKITLILLSVYAALNFLGVLSISSFYDEFGYRLRGPTTNPNQLSMLIVSFFLVLLYSELLNPSNSQTLVIYGLLGLLPVILTGSITGIIVMVLLLVIVIYREVKTFIIAATSIIVTGSFLWEVIANHKAFQRVSAFLNGDSTNQVDVRSEQFNVGLSLFTEYPIFGTGLGQFKIYWHHEMHNSFFFILMELGLIGAFLLVFGSISYLRTQKHKLRQILRFVEFPPEELVHNYRKKGMPHLFPSN